MEKLGKFESEIIKQLKTKGFKYKSVDEIYQQKQLEPEEIEIILKWLPDVYTEHYGTADILVKSLILAKQPFDPSLLIDLFENSQLNFSLKGSIALTLAIARTNDISIWIKNQLLHEKYSLERSELVWALPKKCGFTSSAEVMSFLRKIFDKYHNEVVQKLFKKFGEKKDALFLRKKILTVDKKLAPKIEKIAEFIEKRENKKK